MHMHVHLNGIAGVVDMRGRCQYSRKYWREFNLAVGSQIAFSNILVDLAMCIYASKKVWQLLRQSAKL